MQVTPFQLVLLGVLGFLAYKVLSRPPPGATITSNPAGGTTNVGSPSIFSQVVGLLDDGFKFGSSFENSQSSPDTL